MAYTDWYHQVDPRWLAARRAVITATELVKLIPEYKRQCKKEIPDRYPKACVSLYGKKQVQPTLNEIVSYKDAARGHIMEPYAVHDYNANKMNGLPMFYHWDDTVIYNHDRTLGWSPDALNVYYDPGYLPAVTMSSASTIVLDNGYITDIAPLHALEVKCYGPEHHMENLILKKEKLPERLQLAAGMLAVPSLVSGTLVFYNPSMPDYSLYAHTYTRDDLLAEITLLGNVLAMWVDAKDKLSELTTDMHALKSEDSIHESYLALAAERREEDMHE